MFLCFLDGRKLNYQKKYVKWQNQGSLLKISVERKGKKATEKVNIKRIERKQENGHRNQFINWGIGSQQKKEWT